MKCPECKSYKIEAWWSGDERMAMCLKCSWNGLFSELK